MKQKIIKGSIIPVEIEVTDLPTGVNIQMNSVNLVCTFYAVPPQVPPPPENTIAKVVVKKTEASGNYTISGNMVSNSNLNKIIAIVNTSTLNTGFLYASAEVTYNDSSVGNKNVKLILPIETDIIIVSPIHPHE